MNNWNLENPILKITIRNDTDALSSFYFDWIYECGQSFMQLKQKEKKKTLQVVVPQISVYFIVAQNAIVDNWIHWRTLGYLILMDIYKRER